MFKKISKWLFSRRVENASEDKPIWPFKKMEVNVDWRAQQAQAVIDRNSKDISDLRAWRPIGSEITYLGRTMIVTNHSQYNAISLHYSEIVPMLYVDYADDHGAIHQIKFGLPMARAIMANQP